MGSLRYCKDEFKNTLNYLDFCQRYHIDSDKYSTVFNPNSTGDGIKLYIAYCESYGTTNQEIVNYLGSRISTSSHFIYSLEDEYIQLAKYFKPEWTPPMTVSRAIVYEFCMKHNCDYSESFARKLSGVVKGTDLLRLLHYSELTPCLFGMGYDNLELKELLEVLLESLPNGIPEGYVWSYLRN